MNVIDDTLTNEEMDTLSNDVITSWQNEKRENKISKLMGELEQGTIDVYESENYKNYLKTMSQFHNYSLNNTILIARQNPAATHVAGLTTWNKLGRKVKAGEHGIQIFSPVIKKETEMEQIRNKDGSEDFVEKEVTYTSFKTSYVFDISQTEGKPLPALAKELVGNVAMFDDIKRILEGISPVPVYYEDIKNGAKGYFSLTDEKIVVQRGMSDTQTLKTLIHEISHAKLHGEGSEVTDRRLKEVQAESVAYAVSNYLGINTEDYSFGYLASWSQGKELSELKSSLQVIKDTTSEIVGEIETELQKLDRIEIYQLNENSDALFCSYDELTDKKFINEYERVYIGPLDKNSPDDVYAKFNNSVPENYKGHSLSVSDVVLIHEGEKDTALFIDEYGFKELPEFLKTGKEKEYAYTKTR